MALHMLTNPAGGQETTHNIQSTGWSICTSKITMPTLHKYLSHLPLLQLHSIMLSSLSPVLLLLLSFCSHGLSAELVSHLPGFTGPLPFHLETGYVNVDEVNGVELFYYFVESEGNPREDPVLLWLSGEPGCSVFTALAFEIGPLTFRKVRYNGNLPSLVYNPYSWTKLSSIIFLDSPVGAGFSFSRTSEGYAVGDISSSKQVHKFLLQWFIEHPQFLTNDLYIAGDSYGGKLVPVIAEEISKGIEAGYQPDLNLKGYMTGNPVTGDKFDNNAKVPYLHGFAIISDQLYESVNQSCEGQDHGSPTTADCSNLLNKVQKFLSEIDENHILEPKCVNALTRLNNRRSVNEEYNELQLSPAAPDVWCRTYGYFLSYYWVNNNMTREALHIQKGSPREWIRCNNDVSYTFDIPSSVKYHLNLARKGYRGLVYSGDHDATTPFLGTQGWIRSLNLSIVDDWRSWKVNNQVAGYTRTFANNLTYATVKGAGHTAPEYLPQQCFEMFQRWISHKSL